LKIIKLYFFAYFFITLFYAQAQPLGQKRYIDSLLQLADNKLVNDTLRIAYYNHGAKYYLNINPSFGLQIINKSVSLSTKLGDKAGLARAYDLNGSYFDNLGDYNKALELKFKALKLAENTDNPVLLANIYNNIGVIFFRQKNYLQSVKFYREAYNVAKKHKLIDYEPNFALNIGEVYLKDNKLDSAKFYEERALEISRAFNQKDNMAYCYGILGLIDLKKNNLKSSKTNLETAISLFEQLNDGFALAEYYYHMAEYYYTAKSYDQALNFVDKSIQKGEEIHALEWMKESYYLKSQINRDLKNYEKSLDFRIKANEIAELINNENAQKRFLQLNALYEFEKKQEEIKKLLKEKKDKELELDHQKNINIIYLIVVILIIVFIFIGLYFVHKLRQVNRKLKEERELSDKLLLNILPEKVAKEIKQRGKYYPQYYDNVSIMFADFVSFTSKASLTPDIEIVNQLDNFFNKFDEICEKYGLEKIKTIGDCYMSVCGLPDENPNHALQTVKAAKEMMEYASSKNWALRIGIHSGPVVAGVIGKHKFAYDIWGNAVNIAARIERASEENRINLSESTFNLIKHEFDCELRGLINTKNIGMIEMYYLK
jgi:class 3 adenylate cyclase